MKKIYTNLAPQAVGPYSQAVAWKDLLFTSGQLPIVPESGELAGHTMEDQAEQVMLNLEAVLRAGGSDFQSVIKAVCYLKDMKDFDVFNKVYASCFTEAPARSCIAVKELPGDVLCEVEVIAIANDTKVV